MTRTTNARLAGLMFLFYIAAGATEMVLFGQAIRGEGIAAKLASIAQHATIMRIVGVLSLFTTTATLALAVALYALTRDYDHDLALLALLCCAAQGVIGAMNAVPKLALLPVATAAAGAAASNAAAPNALGSVLLNVQHLGIRGVTLFAVGSVFFSYLFLRARTIPALLAWLGVIASVLLVAGLPLQMVGVIEGNFFMFMPMGVFEVTLALWLLIKGVAAPPAGGAT